MCTLPQNAATPNSHSVLELRVINQAMHFPTPQTHARKHHVPLVILMSCYALHTTREIIESSTRYVTDVGTYLLRRAGGTSDSLQLRTHLFETVVVGVPGDDRDAEEAGHLKEVLRRRRRPAELLGVAEVDDGGAAVEQVLAQRVRNSCVRTKTESSTELQILSSTSVLDF